MARTKLIPQNHTGAGNQRSARKTPVPKPGKKVVKKGGKKGAKGLKGNRTGPVKKPYRYKPGSKL
jgi:hypothetical protein